MDTFFSDSSNGNDSVRWRRELHRHAQPGWLEFFATGFIAQKLDSWGYEIQLGEQIISGEKRKLVPAPAVLEKEYIRALDCGIPEKYLLPAKGGFTGVVGILRGSKKGPVTAFRFDIDALEMVESSHADYRAVCEGYRSEYNGYAHMCGHDAHAATGLLLAKFFAEHREIIRGAVKLIFQPNEENVAGAEAMVAGGVVDDVEYLIAGHVGANLVKTGQISLNVKNMLAVTRNEVIFKGQSAHTTGRPDQGRNALLGACAAALCLHTIASHGLGVSVVNVGRIQSGVGYNVISDRSSLLMELRAGTQEINSYLQEKAQSVVAGAAAMYGLDVEIHPVVNLDAGANDQDMVELATQVAKRVSCVKEIVPEVAINASEDFVFLADAVHKHGGKALYVIHGTPVGAGQHSTAFDIDESVIGNAAHFYAALYQELINTV